MTSLLQTSLRWWGILPLEFRGGKLSHPISQKKGLLEEMVDRMSFPKQPLSDPWGMLPEHLHKQPSVLVQRPLFRDIFKPSTDYMDIPGKDGQRSEGMAALFRMDLHDPGAISGGLPSFTYLASSSFSIARWSNMFLSFSWAISSTRALGKE